MLNARESLLSPVNGTVKQVRLNAKNSQNVVTYETVIDVDNPDLRLKPGMTASPLQIQVQRVDDVVKIPAAALRFRPTTEMFDLIHQPVPPEALRSICQVNYFTIFRQKGAGRLLSRLDLCTPIGLPHCTSG